MEKARCGIEMSNHWHSPPMILIYAAQFFVLFLAVESYFLYVQDYIVAAAIPVVIWVLTQIYMRSTGKGNTSKYLEFDRKNHPGFASTWDGKKIPMATLVEAYIKGKVDFKNDDVLGALEHREEFVCYRITPDTMWDLLSQFIPYYGASFYDKATSKREIADHYDRDTDFFASFLGPSMVYTCALWSDPYSGKESLETAQERKMTTIGNKLQLEKGQKMLDIGCGWGTLARHSEKHFGVKATGVTLSGEGANFCRFANKRDGVNPRILEMDYRDIPKDEIFDAISCVEMAEHVGISNMVPFVKQVGSHLKDDGLFYMQVAGLRQGSNWQDTAWALFMGRYIFPAADASTPLNWYIKQLELGGMEVRSVETVGRQYSHTLHGWYKNFMKNHTTLDPKKAPAGLVRLWKIFLAWSVIASGQGSASCYQIVAHKNMYTYDRDKFVAETDPHSPVGSNAKGGAFAHVKAAPAASRRRSATPTKKGRGKSPASKRK